MGTRECVHLSPCSAFLDPSILEFLIRQHEPASHVSVDDQIRFSRKQTPQSLAVSMVRVEWPWDGHLWKVREKLSFIAGSANVLTDCLGPLELQLPELSQVGPGGQAFIVSHSPAPECGFCPWNDHDFR